MTASNQPGSEVLVEGLEPAIIGGDPAGAHQGDTHSVRLPSRPYAPGTPCSRVYSEPREPMTRVRADSRVASGVISCPGIMREVLLHHHEAAVHAKDLARDERGLVAGEERDGVGDLLGRAEPRERRPVRDLVLQRVGEVLRQLGQHEAGSNRVDVMERLANSRALAFVRPIKPAFADE